MTVLHIEFPPPKVHGTIKGTSFIASATKHHTLVGLHLTPTKRRSQVHIFKQCVTDLGVPKDGTSSVGFLRIGNVVTVGAMSSSLAPSLLFWTANPGMLRAYLAVHHALMESVVPQDITDFAYLIWLLREKDGEALWKWPVSASSPAPTNPSLLANGLTPVFASAKMVLVNGEPIARKGALRGLPVSD